MCAYSDVGSPRTDTRASSPPPRVVNGTPTATAGSLSKAASNSSGPLSVTSSASTVKGDALPSPTNRTSPGQITASASRGRALAPSASSSGNTMRSFTDIGMVLGSDSFVLLESLLHRCKLLNLLPSQCCFSGGDDLAMAADTKVCLVKCHYITCLMLFVSHCSMHPPRVCADC